MPPAYQTIRPFVLQTLSREMRTLQDIYGVATIGVFGSVIREEDTPKSDVDILVTYLRPSIEAEVVEI
ncbi:MAG: nucleotidyltransferase domain-containing protein [Methanocorpusculum sp.]|nr:nucleotidyltransferase domain-containing protein [Methanocorpusculum sp.]